MRRDAFGTIVCLTALLASRAAVPASAQVVGTFRWQLQPYCNVLTVLVVQSGGVYTLDGYDDQCGGGTVRAPLVGQATPNPDGTIGLGFSVVTAPSGRPVHISANITLATVSGTWSDSAGGSGTFAFNGAAAGSARPQPTAAPSWGAVVQGPPTSAAPGLLVHNPDPSSSATPAIVGQAGPAPTLGSSGAAGVVGQSRDQVGVAGVSDVAIGVIGASGAGFGVVGTSITGIGVVASSSAGDTALLVANGAIGVAGTTRSVFQHTAISGAGGNIVGNLTRIDHPLLNDDPNALVFVTHVFQDPSSSVYIPDGVGVYYGGGRWTIYRENFSLNMTNGAKFNVLVVKQ